MKNACKWVFGLSLPVTLSMWDDAGFSALRNLLVNEPEFILPRQIISLIF
jgi:hypothetical protein